MNSILQHSINNLYSCCVDFKKPIEIISCDCCHEEGQKVKLITVPLRDLTCRDLDDFVGSSFNTIGCREDFLYFLPRILELALTEYGGFEFDAGLLGNKLYRSEFWKYSDELHFAVNDTLLAHFRYQVLEDTDWNCELSEWVCAIGNAMPDIDPYLELLYRSYFKEFYDREYQYAVEGRLSDAFWEDSHGNMQKVIKWLMSHRIDCKRQ